MEALDQHTPYAEVNFILRELLTSVQSILGDHFVGMYLYGSLASGDFDSASDVDYVVVTDGDISDKAFGALDTMHQRIAAMDVWCATQLEGSYIPGDALRQFDDVRAVHVHLDRGEGERLHRMRLEDPLISRAWWGGWAILRHTLRERGIALAGPPLQTLIDPVSPDDLREAASAILPGWTKQILENPAEISGRGYQSYTVLTVCRILYTLESGLVVSKRAAGEWAQEALDPRWRPLIESAWVGRQNPQLQTNAEDVSQTLDFILYGLEHSQHGEAFPTGQG
jgi:hypothetical protein